MKIISDRFSLRLYSLRHISHTITNSLIHLLSVPVSQPTTVKTNHTPLQSGPGGYRPPPPADGQQAWMVPPYPGPPNYANNPPPPQGWDKSDYHPDAEWAQADYASPSSRERDIGDNREEEEAWERARSQGVTAHLTGHAPLRAREDVERDSGYVIPNAEEDQAWEEARNQGVTAHLTGAATRREREGGV